MDEDSCFDNVNVLKDSYVPMDRTLAHLHETMAEIIAKCTTSASIKLCDHAPSLLQGFASNIHCFHLACVNKPMHPRMVFHRMDDGCGNSINQMKD
jgi:hypothetical protein